MPKDPIPLAPLQRGGQVGLAVADISHSAERLRVEDGVDGGDVEAAEVMHAAQAAAVDLKGVKLAAEQGQNSARYFTDWVLPQLDLLLPDNDQPIEVWTTLDPTARVLLQVKVEDADVTDEIFTRLMGDVVEPRREFIQENALNVANLDV